MTWGEVIFGEIVWGEEPAGGGGGGSTETASGGIVFQHLILSGSAIHGETGFGGILFNHLKLAGIVAHGETGTGAFHVQHLHLSGIAAKGPAGSGGIHFQHLKLNGAASRGSDGPGAVVFKHLKLGGSSVITHNATAGIKFKHLALAGSAANAAGHTKFASGEIRFNKISIFGSSSDIAHSVIPVVDPAISPYWRGKLPLDFLRWLSDNFTSLKQLSNVVTFGYGPPNGIYIANPGTVFIRLDGGTGSTLYVKETGTGNTGWAAK